MRYMAKKHKGALALRIEFHGRFEKHHAAICSIADKLEIRPTSLARAVLADFAIHKSDTFVKRVLKSLHEYEQLDLVGGVEKKSPKTKGKFQKKIPKPKATRRPKKNRKAKSKPNRKLKKRMSKKQGRVNKSARLVVDSSYQMP